jgi:hypothetical protein
MLSFSVSHHERYSQHHTDRVTFATIDTRNGPPCGIAQQPKQRPTSHLGADTSPEACELAVGDRRVAEAMAPPRGRRTTKAIAVRRSSVGRKMSAETVRRATRLRRSEYVLSRLNATQRRKPEAARLSGGRVLARPLHDATRVREDSSVIEDQDGHLGRTTQAGDLGTVSLAAHALPQRKAIPLHSAELVLMPGRIERSRGASARMAGSPERLLLTAGVKNHGGQPIGTAATRPREAGSLSRAPSHPPSGLSARPPATQHLSAIAFRFGPARTGGSPAIKG